MNTQEVTTIVASAVAVAMTLLAVMQRMGVLGPASKGKRAKSDPPPLPHPRRSEQLGQAGEWMSDTQRDLRAASLGGMRCDRHQEIENAVAELASAARARDATGQLRFDAIDRRLDSHHTVLSEVRDAMLRLETQRQGEPARYPVGIVRGGAAR